MTSTVTITGVGLVTAVGDCAEETWRSIVAGRSGVATNTLFDTSALMTTWAGMITTQQDPSLDRCYALSRTAVREALEVSGLEVTDANRDRIAVVVGSSLGAMPTLEATQRRFADEGELDAAAAAGSLLHCVADFIAGEFDLRGPRVVPSNACAAGAVAVGYAAELLWHGDVDYVICGGVDPLANLSANGFTCLGALDEQPCSPMAASTGLTLGEGAGFMVLERSGTARARGAREIAEVAGYGTTCDGYHQTAPDPGGEGAHQSMSAALATAGLSPEDVDYVNLHGTGTPTNDSVEPKALKLLFGAERVPPASSTKSAMGHTLGAAGAIETICSVLAIDTNTLPPTINSRGVANSTGLDVVPGVGRAAETNVVLSNSFAFGGNNASVVVTAPGHGGKQVTHEAARPALLTGIAGISGDAVTTEQLVHALASGSTTAGSQEETADGELVTVGRIDLKPLKRRINPSKVRRMDPMGVMSCAVVADLYDQIGKPSRQEAEATGIIFGTGYGPLTAVTTFIDGLIHQDSGGANPLVFPNTVVNAAAGHLAMLNHYRGYTATLACGGTSTIMALQLAARVISRGGAERIMVVVTDEFPALSVKTAAKLPGYRDSLDAEGAILGEGAVALLVESPEAAAQRGARPLASLDGFGGSGEPTPLGERGASGAGWSRAINQSLEQAGITPADVCHVMSSASGNRLLDAAEHDALQLSDLSHVPRTAPKLQLGETHGSAAGLALLAGLRTGRATAGDRLLVTATAAGGSYASMVVGVL